MKFIDHDHELGVVKILWNLNRHILPIDARLLLPPAS